MGRATPLPVFNIKCIFPNYFLERLSVNSSNTWIDEALSHQTIWVASEVCYLIYLYTKTIIEIASDSHGLLYFSSKNVNILLLWELIVLLG